MERMENDIFAIITELENYLESAKRVPLTNQIMLERSSALNLIKMMRDSLPEAIKSANRITNQESRILQEAKKHYENLTAEADAKAQKLRLESEQRAQATLADASKQADQMLADAQRQADAVVNSAQRKADELVAQTAVMARAEQQANEILTNARGESQRVRVMALEHCADLFKRCENEAITIANELRDARIQLDQER